ncbi:MAG: HAD family hydrolase [Myxococcaceae bacterium]|nr:HAD family hydrolase [Myxococcaceae bacterium]
MRSVRHVIWDWNGTLLDDAWLCVEVMADLLEAHALPPMDAARYQDLFTFPVVDYYRRLGFDFERAPFEQVGTAFIHGYQARQHECRLQEGAHAVFDALSARGVPMSILSASQQSRLEAQVSHLGITGRFVRLIGLDHHYADGKLELGRRWVAELGVPADEVLLVGDTDHDLHVAQALGLRCLIVPSGHQSRERLERAGATVLDDLRALLDELG